MYPYVHQDHSCVKQHQNFVEIIPCLFTSHFRHKVFHIIPQMET